jgi:ATPase subunit of ABC transporter with duplicated ATPase domains
MIVIKQLRVDVFGEPLFEKVNVVIATGERMGVLGARASDVTAFLRVIADEDEMDEGTITRDGERVGYVSPEILEGGADALARVLHARPTVLIIDTHGASPAVDMQAVQRFVAQFRGGVLIASENAELMHAARVTRILEIDPATRSVSSFTGDYATYQVEREKVQARIAEAYEKQQREKRRLEIWLEQKRMEATKDRAPEKGATIRTKAKYLQREILDKEIPKPFHLEQGDSN